MRLRLSRHILIAGGAAASVGLCAALAGGTRARPAVDGPPPAIYAPDQATEAAPPAEPVAGPGDISVHVQVVGVVVPAEQFAVRARVDGFVARPLKRPGEPVAVGEAVVLLDDADLLLDRDRCRARAEAAAQRCAAARADLRALEQKREHLRALHATRTAAAYELTQTQAEVEVAAARVKALDEERKEASSEGVALERRIGCCRCAAQGAGTLGELLRGAGDYVRTGDPVAVVHSPRRQVRVLLPSATCRGAAAFSFALAWNGEWQALLPSLTEGPQAELSQAERSVALEIPAGVDLQIGQTVDVEVVAP